MLATLAFFHTLKSNNHYGCCCLSNANMTVSSAFFALSITVNGLIERIKRCLVSGNIPVPKKKSVE